MGIKIVVGTREKPVRLSFVHVFEPFAYEEGQTKKYSLQAIIPKGDKDAIAKVEKAIQAAIKEALGKKVFSEAATKSPDFKRCLRDGDNKAALVDEGSQDYLKGHVFFNASNVKVRPGVVDTNLQPIMDADEVYSGCYGLVSVEFYGYKHKSGGVGVTASLQHVMKCADGDSLGVQRESADKAFAGLADSEGDTAPSEGGDDLR